MKKTFAVFLIISICFTLSSCDKNSLESLFADWEPECYDPSVAFINQHTGEIKYNGKTINVDNCLPEHTDRVFLTCIAVVNDALYYTFLRNSKEEEFFYGVELWSVNLANFTTEILYTHHCHPTGNPDAIYPKSYYFDRNIYIYDGVTVGVFNIDTHTVESRDADYFIPPTMSKYIIERPKDCAGERIFIKTFGDYFEREITYEYLAQRNEYAARLEEARNMVSFSSVLGHGPMDRFFLSQSVINDTIYLLCYVEDHDQESNYIVFSYNFESDTFKFLHHAFIGFSGEGLIVEVIPVE